MLEGNDDINDVDFITKYLFSEKDIQQFGLFPCPYISGLYTKKSTHHTFDRRIDIKEQGGSCEKARE